MTALASICDSRYGSSNAIAQVGGGPFAAGKGAIVTDGVSAFFEVGRSAVLSAPEAVTRVLRPLMTRPKDALATPFSDLTGWLAEHFPSCGGCADEAVCPCTVRAGRVAGVPVYGWHVRRQLDQVGHRPARVYLAALVDGRSQPVLHVSCEKWTYVRVGLIGPIAGDLPIFKRDRS